MPRKGYSVITVPTTLQEDLKTEADAGGVSVPDLIQNLIDMKRGLRVPLHHNSQQDVEGVVYDVHYFVEVTRRDFRTIRRASRYYQKTPTAIVQKFIDQF